MSIVQIDNLGTFKYNYIINPNEKYNVISACLFKAKDVSNFSRYITNLLKFKDFEIFKNKNFVFRLYYDDSILEDKYIKKMFSQLNKHYQLIHYDCPQFKNKDGRHNGVFGMLMRFLPFHDFPENDVNWCYITDLDGSSDSIEYKLNFLWKSVSKYKIDFLYTYWYCHSTSHGISQDNYILGNRFLIKSKIPVEHLVSYVNNFVDNIFDVYKNLRDNINIQKDKKYHHKFFYGIDEIYLELIVIMYIKKNKIKYGRYVSYHFISLDELLKSLFRKVDENNSSFIKIINSINKKYNTNYKNINDFFDFFKDYDWYRKTNMYKQYEFFHKKAIKLYDKEPTLEKSKRFDSCFRKIPKFLDKTNIIEIFN